MKLDLLKPHVDVGLVTGNAAKARAFYGDTLGLRPLAPRPLGGGLVQHRFLIGGQVLKLIEAPDPPPYYPGGTTSAIGYRRLGLAVDDLTASGNPGSDADGNAIELSQHQGGEERIRVGLTVSDLDRTAHFYGDVLGLPERTSGSANADERAFAAGHSTLELRRAAEPLPTRTGPLLDAVGIRYVTFAVRGVTSLCKELEGRGARIALPPREMGGIVRIAFVADPDGNWIEFGEPCT